MAQVMTPVVVFVVIWALASAAAAATSVTVVNDFILTSVL